MTFTETFRAEDIPAGTLREYLVHLRRTRPHLATRTDWTKGGDDNWHCEGWVFIPDSARRNDKENAFVWVGGMSE